MRTQASYSPAILNNSLNKNPSLSLVPKIQFLNPSNLNPPNPLLLATYGSQDLAERPAFQGGYINFGYWKDILPKEGHLTIEDRVKASEALYDLVIKNLAIQPEDSVLEIGCGRGYGCAKVAKIINPFLVIGVDITPEQIERSNKIHANLCTQMPNLFFKVGSSESIPFDNENFTKIYSVEAAQCFPSMLNFAKEAWRVLEFGGKLVIVAHFATGERERHLLRKLIPTIDQGVDLLLPIGQVRQSFIESGFKEVSFESIGNHVFKGFKKWRARIKDAKWADNIFHSYQMGYMDYYLINLEK